MFSSLTAAIDDLCALNPATLGDTDLDAAVAGLLAARDRLAVATAQVVQAWDTRRTWAHDGSRSPSHRMARLTGRSLATCRVEIRRARNLTALPATTAAVTAGTLSIDHLDLLERAATSRRAAVFAVHEPLLVETITGLPFRDATVVVRRWIALVDAVTDDDDPPAPPPEDPTEDRSLFASETVDGVVEITGHLDALGGAVFRNELDRLTERERLADRRAGIDRTPAQRRAAALIAMAQRSATVTGGAAPRVVLQVLVGEGTLRSLCELYDGTQVNLHALRPYLDDAVLETLLFDGPSTVLSVSRKRRFTGALRTAIKARDRHCRHPSGCDVPADACDLDHVVPWSEGGETSQWNGRLECTTHNRLPDRHDHHAEPLPARPITALDVVRAKLRRRERRAWERRHRRGRTVPPRRRVRTTREVRRVRRSDLQRVAARSDGSGTLAA